MLWSLYKFFPMDEFTCKLILNDKIFEFPSDIELFKKIKSTVSNYLINKRSYEVQSTVRCETFQLFLNYWKNEIDLVINESNIWEFTQLNNEFGLLEEYLSSPDIEQLFNISNLLHSDYLPNLKNLEKYNYNKSFIEQSISHQLDKYIAESPNELSQIPLTSLYNIFYNKERVLNDHDQAYLFIINNQNQNFFLLIGSLDANKFKNSELLKDSISNNITLNKCTFKSNQALPHESNTELFGGSSIFLTSKCLYITNCSFHKGKGSGGSVKIYNVFDSNSRKIAQYMENENKFLISNCNFDNDKDFVESISYISDNNNNNNNTYIYNCFFDGKFVDNYIDETQSSSVKVIVESCTFNFDLHTTLNINSINCSSYSVSNDKKSLSFSPLAYVVVIGIVMLTCFIHKKKKALNQINDYNI